MARPCVLINRGTLDQIYSHYSNGVPVSVLVRKFELSVSQPTLAKLLKWLELAYDPNTVVSEQILSSLFPEWTEDISLSKSNNPCVVKPHDWHYVGKMPLGYWAKHEWAESIMQELVGDETYA